MEGKGHGTCKDVPTPVFMLNLRNHESTSRCRGSIRAEI
jgi:hypothetical protein